MPLLRQALLDTYLVRLRTIARFWEIPLTSTRQREVALELAEAMAEPRAVQRVLADLPDDQREALAALLSSDGNMPARVFSREWGEIRAMGPGRMERERPWEDPLSPAEGLWYRGLLFTSFEGKPDGAFEAVFVPPEILDHLPSQESEQSTITLEPASAPTTVVSGGDLLLDDTCTLLAYIHNHRPKLRPDQGWSAPHEQRLQGRLRDSDTARFAFLSHLALHAGLLVNQKSKRARLLPEAVTNWLQSDTSAQRGAMVEAWRDDPTWNDLFHVPALQPEDTGAWRNDPLLPRQAIFRHLKACDPGTWYRVEEFISAIKEANPDFQRPDGDYASWYIRDANTGRYLSGFESWDAVEGRLIRYLLTKPMSWLGLIDLGAEGKEEPTHAFRLSEEGAAYLDLSDPPPASAPPPARLRPGFRVMVPAPRRYERFQLSRVAEWVESSKRFIYRLTPMSMERARQQGIPVARVVEFLEEITEAPVPQSTAQAISQWDARGTEVRLEGAILLRFSTEALMERSMASPRLERLVAERVGPTTALIDRQDWPEVVAQLEAIGLLPELKNLSA